MSCPDAYEALAALETLCAPFSEVAWEAAMHKSAFIGFVLTLVARNILPTVPAFVFTSPIAGAGKSLLVESAAMIVFGHKPGLRPYPDKGDEMRKVLHAAMLAGDPLVVFDNLYNGAAIGDAALNAYLTGEVMADRTLGVSESPRTVNLSCFAFTGVNISARADSVRRFLAVSIDPNCEHPEQRAFTIEDLVDHCRENRPTLLHAALTILRAFIFANAPRIAEREPLGSYVVWDRLIAGCLAWLNLPDPVETQRELADVDLDAGNTVAVLTQLEREFGRKSFTFPDIRSKCEMGPLAEIVSTVCGGNQDKNINRFALWLRAHEGQVRGGMKLVREGLTHGRARYQIVRLESSTSVSQDLSETPATSMSDDY